ncbi:MAG: N-acetyltransferase, partial [Rhodocyclaceae bacterium]
MGADHRDGCRGEGTCRCAVGFARPVTPPDVRVAAVDLDDPAQAASFLALLDHYARDPMGGGDGLHPGVRARLPAALRMQPGFHGALAWQGADAVGLINCFTGFSTFAAQALLNVHDIVVHQDERGRGIGQSLLAWAETRARELGCCKLTLEVLSRNERAMASYRRAGFVPYEL